MLRGFIKLNKRACATISRCVPQARFRAELEYIDEVKRLIGLRPRQSVLDIGAGRRSRFAEFTESRSSCTVFATDIAYDCIIENAGANFRVVCDLCRGLPFSDESIDLIVSRSALEHLQDLRSLMKDSARVLRPGGYCAHFFPCRYAPFALVNRALPNSLSRQLMHRIHVGTDKTCGFAAYYPKCYPSAFEGLLRDSGFEVIGSRLCYYQSHYFDFLVPLYLVSVAYEMIVSLFGMRDLCAYAIVIARRTP